MTEMYEVFQTSYLNEGQCKPDTDVMVLGHMAIIPFPFFVQMPQGIKENKDD